MTIRASQSSRFSSSRSLAPSCACIDLGQHVTSQTDLHAVRQGSLRPHRWTACRACDPPALYSFMR